MPDSLGSAAHAGEHGTGKAGHRTRTPAADGRAGPGTGAGEGVRQWRGRVIRVVAGRWRQLEAWRP